MKYEKFNRLSFDIQNFEIQIFKLFKVTFGMINNKIESVKMIGRREMNMDENIEKWIRVYEIGQSSYYAKPFFNDAKESFIRGYCISKL